MVCLHVSKFKLLPAPWRISNIPLSISSSQLTRVLISGSKENLQCLNFIIDSGFYHGIDLGIKNHVVSLVLVLTTSFLVW